MIETLKANIERSKSTVFPRTNTAITWNKLSVDLSLLMKLFITKNGNKLDNRLENLEVMSRLEHSRLHLQKHDYSKICSVCGKEFTPKPTHRQRAKVCSEKCKRINDSKNHSVPVEQLSHSGEVIRVWNSATEAAKALGGERTSIVVCLKGRGKTALGYKWRYRNG